MPPRSSPAKVSLRVPDPKHLEPSACRQVAGAVRYDTVEARRDGVLGLVDDARRRVDRRRRVGEAPSPGAGRSGHAVGRDLEHVTVAVGPVDVRGPPARAVADGAGEAGVGLLELTSIGVEEERRGTPLGHRVTGHPGRGRTTGAATLPVSAAEGGHPAVAARRGAVVVRRVARAAPGARPDQRPVPAPAAPLSPRAAAVRRAPRSLTSGPGDPDAGQRPALPPYQRPAAEVPAESFLLASRAVPPSRSRCHPGS